MNKPLNLIQMTLSVSNRTIFVSSFIASLAVIGFLVWLIYLKESPADLSSSASVLPAVNACLNALSACFIITGYFFIRLGRINIHRAFMIAALVSSSLFLVSYIWYHNTHGDTPFQGTGFIRPVYFFILISHILLTIVALPMILTTVSFALMTKFDSHKRIARYTFPAWLYVSLTGVLIFFFLKAFS
jgi:putative membrane protein